MCISPSPIYTGKLNTGVATLVPCRKCWACRQDHLNDLVGRCLCEASASDHVWHVTLTYDDKRLEDPQQARIPRKADFQDFVKRMRRSFKMRYIVVSETGSKNTKRVHFHAILFFRERVPQWNTNQRHWDYPKWPWGHIWVDPVVNESSMRYVLKYALKDVENEAAWLSYSRIPIMGVDHAQFYGLRYASEKLIPRNFKYRPPGAQDNREYQFKGESRFIMLDEFFKHWPEAWEKPMSETMANSVTAYVKDRQRKAFERMCITAQMLERERSTNPGFAKPLTDWHHMSYLWEKYFIHIEVNHGKEARIEAEAQHYARAGDGQPPGS